MPKPVKAKDAETAARCKQYRSIFSWRAKLITVQRAIGRLLGRSHR